MRKFFNRRTLFIAVTVLLLTGASTIAGLYLFFNSPAFSERIRQTIVSEIEKQTGAGASLKGIHWDLRSRRIVLDNLTLRGLEPPSDPPLATIESITARLSLRNLFSRRVDLSELSVLHPQLRLLVDDEGKTNLPGPLRLPDIAESRFAISIKSLGVIGGSVLINDRRMNIDFTLADVASESTYRGDTRVLSVKLAYKGTLQQDGQAAIPYTLSTDFDLTAGTIVAQRIDVASGTSSAKLQGRIDHALTAGILGRLSYTGDLEASFLGRFLPAEKLGGRAKAAGDLEFKRNSFSTRGKMEAGQADLNTWSASAIRANYSYDYPARQLTLTHVSAQTLGGTAAGTIRVSPVPGEAHVSVELDYTDVDSAQLAGVYPWDPKYVVYSRLSGHLQGWFEGRAERFEIEGDTEMVSYPPEAVTGVTAFPITGTVSFLATPADVDVRSSDLHFFDTAIQADGRIHSEQSALNVRLRSSNLANLRFLYKDANGEGTFDGTLQGEIRRPQLNGHVTLNRYKYREWTIRQAEGNATLDMQTELATLTNVRTTVGQSTATLDGRTNLDGSNLRLRIRSDRIDATDFASIMKEKVEGILSGDVSVSSLSPLEVVGHVKAAGLTARGGTLETAEGDLILADPSVEIRNLTASDRGARLTEGKAKYNRTTEGLEFQGNVSGLKLNRIRDLGVPETLEGTIQRAHLTVGGTLRRPELGGDGTIENLAFRGEVFPRARLQMSTVWPTLTAVLSGTGNLDLSARIDLSDDRYPYEASAKFQNYSLEKVAQLGHASLTASGDAALTGSLRGSAPFSAKGTVRSIHAQIEDYPFDGSKPFGFSVEADELKLSEETSFNGPRGTKVDLVGSIGLTNSPRLDLTANGNLDLRVFAELNPSWSITGIVNFKGHIGGTSAKPTIDGLASFSNASLGYEGIYTTLSMLSGDVRFSENRVTFDNMEGRVGGGTIHVRGTGLIQNNQMEGLNVLIETDQVRFRYPVGLRSTVNGTLLVRGTTSNPLLDGDLTLGSINYRSDFEPFLAIFRPGGLDSGGTVLDRLRLSIHVAGNRNITIQNELTDIRGARVDLDIKGTLGSPSLTGHVEVDDGTLLFQGKRYAITRGNIDFVDPLRIDPVVNVQAESDLRDYRVTLNIAGRGDNVRIELNSDPPLPQLDLVSLMAGGKTQDELQEAGATSIPTSEEVFRGTAASVLVDLLRSKLGNRFGLLGLDRVRIDPYLVGAGNKSAQVTLSVTRDLSVTYSQDLSSNQQRVIQVEYFLSKDLSLVASREENNETTALGLDVKLRRRF